MKKSLHLICLFVVLQVTANAQFTSSTSDNNQSLSLNRSYLTESLMFPGNQTNQFNSDPVIDPQVYKKRKRTFLTVGLVLLGTGLISGGAGLLLANDNSYDSRNGDAAATLLVVSAVTGIASIPFMSLSLAANNRYKAAIKSQPTAYGLPRNISKQVTGLSLSIPIGN